MARRVGQSLMQFVLVFWANCATRSGRKIVWHSRGLRRYCPIRGWASKWLVTQWAHLSHVLHLLRASIRHRVNAQRAVYVEQAAFEFQAAALLPNLGPLLQRLRRFSSPRPPRGQRLLDVSGHPVDTAADEQRLLRDHFAQLAAGMPTSFGELSLANAPVRTASRLIVEDASLFPARPEVYCGISCAKLRKAIGESRLGAEAFKLCPVESARAVHLLYCKSLLNAEAPLQWKGSQLATLYKGKGRRTAISSFRDVPLGDPDTKLYGKILRSLFCIVLRHLVRICDLARALGVVAATYFT